VTKVAATQAQLAPAPTRTVPAGPSSVRTIQFHGRDGQGDLDIVFNGEARVTEGVATASYAELIVDGVSLPAQLERSKQDVTTFGSTVRNVSIVRDPRDPGRFYVRIALLAPTVASVRRSAGSIRWHFRSEDMP